MNIQYLTHQQIDKTKWDKCINTAANGLLYACSKYLDCMAGQWHALVVNDYEIIMPLPRRKKWGINYLFQPSITPELGVFGTDVNPDIVHQFLKAIPTKFRVWDLSFNYSNKISRSDGIVITRNNYILNIGGAYSQIAQGYSENINRNITKAVKEGCVVKKGISFSDIAAICKTEFPKFTKVEPGLFDKLLAVYNNYQNSAATYGVYTKDGLLLASCIFLFYKQRAYYWLVGNNPESREYGASSLLIDSFIKDYGGKNLILDFEGSDAEPIAGFYKKFGAVLEPYTTLYVNKLPQPFKLLKPLPRYYHLLISKYK